MRWDSDHVVLFDDEIREIAKEIVRNNAQKKVLIATDYFDASINRIAAWAVGVRSVQKALLWAALQPHETMREMQDGARFTELMALGEEMKTLPFGGVWEEYLRRENVPGEDWLGKVKEYEDKVLSRRK